MIFKQLATTNHDIIIAIPDFFPDMPVEETLTSNKSSFEALDALMINHIAALQDGNSFFEIVRFKGPRDHAVRAVNRYRATLDQEIRKAKITIPAIYSNNNGEVSITPRDRLPNNTPATYDWLGAVVLSVFGAISIASLVLGEYSNESPSLPDQNLVNSFSLFFLGVVLLVVIGLDAKGYTDILGHRPPRTRLLNPDGIKGHPHSDAHHVSEEDLVSIHLPEAYGGTLCVIQGANDDNDTAVLSRLHTIKSETDSKRVPMGPKGLLDRKERFEACTVVFIIDSKFEKKLEKKDPPIVRAVNSSRETQLDITPICSIQDPHVAGTLTAQVTKTLDEEKWGPLLQTVESEGVKMLASVMEQLVPYHLHALHDTHVVGMLKEIKDPITRWKTSILLCSNQNLILTPRLIGILKQIEDEHDGPQQITETQLETRWKELTNNNGTLLQQTTMTIIECIEKGHVPERTFDPCTDDNPIISRVNFRELRDIIRKANSHLSTDRIIKALRLDQLKYKEPRHSSENNDIARHYRAYLYFAHPTILSTLLKRAQNSDEAIDLIQSNSNITTTIEYILNRDLLDPRVEGPCQAHQSEERGSNA